MRIASFLVPVLLLFCSAARCEGTLYAALGERAGIARIVSDLERHSLADPRIGAIFGNSNIERLHERLTAFICERTGGPCHYPGRDMHHVHRGLFLTVANFNALVEDLEQALDDNHIPFAQQNALLAILSPLQRDIVAH